MFYWIQRIQWQKICQCSKRAQTCHSATCCVRVQDATTAPARHMWETGSLNQAQFMLQWLSISLNSLNSVKVPLRLGKTPLFFLQYLRHFSISSCNTVFPELFWWFQIVNSTFIHQRVRINQTDASVSITVEMCPTWLPIMTLLLNSADERWKVTILQKTIDLSLPIKCI